MRLILTVASAVVTMTIAGALDAQTPTSQIPATQGEATRRDNPDVQSDAAKFVNQMTVAGMAEVQLGNIAAERAASKDVKSFGDMMARDHRQANQDLAQVAARLNIKPTSELDRKHLELIDRLSRVRGAEFDREYINAMVRGHEEVAGQLEARAGAAMHSPEADRPRLPSPTSPPTENPNDPPRTPAEAPGAATRTPALSNGNAAGASHAANEPHKHALMEWAQRTLPAVQKHLQRAREIQRQLDK